MEPLASLMLPTAEREFPLAWNPVNAHGLIDLPHPWPILKQRGFNSTLYDRVRRFWTAVSNDGHQTYLKEPLVVLGESFRNGFNAKNIQVPSGHVTCPGPLAQTLEMLMADFKGLISPILWNTIASLAARPDPYREDTILNAQEHLPYAWGICDAALHAMGKSYRLFFHVEERLRNGIGAVLLHGCGCDHHLDGLLAGDIRFPLLPDTTPMRFKAAKEWLDHFLGELVLIFVNGYPFRLNPEDFNSTKVVALRRVP